MDVPRNYVVENPAINLSFIPQSSGNAAVSSSVSHMQPTDVGQEYRKIFQGVIDFADTIRKILVEKGVKWESGRMAEVLGKIQSLPLNSDVEMAQNAQQVSVFILTTFALIADIFKAVVDNSGIVETAVNPEQIRVKTEDMKGHNSNGHGEICIQIPAASEVNKVASSPGMTAFSTIITSDSDQVNFISCQTASSLSQEQNSDRCITQDDGNELDGTDNFANAYKSVGDDADHTQFVTSPRFSSLASKQKSCSTKHSGAEQNTQANLLTNTEKTKPPASTSSPSCNGRCAVENLKHKNLQLSKQTETLEDKNEGFETPFTGSEIGEQSHQPSFAKGHISHTSSRRRRRGKSVTCDCCPRTLPEEKDKDSKIPFSGSEIDKQSHQLSNPEKNIGLAGRKRGRKRKPLTCDHCPEKFTERKLVLAHMRTCHPDMPDVCAKEAKKRTEKKLTCDYCPQSYLERKHVIVHMRSCHADIPAVAKAKGGRKRKPLTCDYCSKTFKHRRMVIPHMRRCHSEMPGIDMTFVCSICGKTNGSNQELLTHMMRHMVKVRSFACTQCPKTFMMENDLRSHVREVHKGVKPYLCTTCGSSFSKSSTLKRHLIVHTGAKNHGCDLCGKLFSQSSQLSRHVKAIHSTVRPFKCPLCPAEYSDRTGLKVHLQRAKVHAGESLDVDDVLIKAGYPVTDTCRISVSK